MQKGTPACSVKRSQNQVDLFRPPVQPLTRYSSIGASFPLRKANHMTPRQLRRAAERKAQKEARRAANQFASIPSAETEQIENSGTEPGTEHPTISPAQLAANRANAQLSTGPTTATGKAISSLNAVKTALTGRTVLLPSDDAAEYERHIRAYAKELQPLGQRECDLAQSIADIAWRLKRIPGLIMAIFARGRIEFADSFQQHDASLRPGLIEIETSLAYEKQLRNLQLQEGRLARRREKETAELRRLQQERSQREAEDLDTLSKVYLLAKRENKPFDPAQYGSEFSVHDVECYIEGRRAAQSARQTRQQQPEQAKTHHEFEGHSRERAALSRTAESVI